MLSIHSLQRARRLVLLAFAAAALGLTGCATQKTGGVPVNYAPSSVKSATGTLTVGDFRYLPAETATDPVPSNRIRNTAMGRIDIDRDVKVFVRDAIFAEMRFVGVKTNDPARILTADIEDFLVDDLGFNVDWKLRIKYVVTDSATKKVIYEGVKSVDRRTAKFANAFGALNETIKLIFEQLIDDKDFQKAIS